MTRDEALAKALANVAIDGHRRRVRQSKARPGQWFVSLGEGRVRLRNGDRRRWRVYHQFEWQDGWVDLGPVNR